MGPKARREREREAVRAKILDAARELFAAHGYEAVTMRKIAERIDYTATALYTHFADKESLLRAVCDEDFRALRSAFERIARLPDPVERLRRIGQAYVGFALEHPNHYRLLFMTAHPPHEPTSIEKGDPDQDAYAFLRATVAEALAAGRLGGRHDDAELVAQVLWSGVHGVVALHMTHADDPWIEWRPLKARAQVMVDVLIHGLTAS
jgi:AcrR family transcriptional regulator